MQPTETINASGAPERPASQTEVPDWAIQTPEPPEPEECWPPYVLMVQEHEGKHLQTVELTRAEYIGLKKHLAVMRGLPVPKDDEPEAAAGAAKPTNGAASEAAGATDDPISGRLVGSMIEGIINDLKDHQDFIATRGIKCTASDWSEFQADAALLKEIVADWTGDGYLDDFPKETKLIGTIRAHLDL